MLGNITIAKEMIAAGADINRADEIGSIKNNLIQLCDRIQRYFFFCSGWTPLLKAIWAHNEEYVFFYIDYRCDEFKFIFHILFRVVDLLIQNGADVNHHLQSGQGWSGNV